MKFCECKIYCKIFSKGEEHWTELNLSYNFKNWFIFNVCFQCSFTVFYRDGDIRPNCKFCHYHSTECKTLAKGCLLDSMPNKCTKFVFFVTQCKCIVHKMIYWLQTKYNYNYSSKRQEAQLPQRNSTSAVHVYLGWLTDRAVHRTPQSQMLYN